MRRKKIVITTVGSLGDLHPYIALALGLQMRGHEVIIATGECYRKKIETLEIGFRAVRPDCAWVTNPDIMRRYMDLRKGLLRVSRELLLPSLRESYDDLSAVAEGADLIVSQIPLAARLVAEKTGIPWVSTIHTPLFFFSAYDLPIMPVAPILSRRLRFLGPVFWKPLFWFSKRASRFLANPWYQLRADIGLPPTKDGNPLGDSHSPTLVLALFSNLIADIQPDWPPQSVVTGFPLYDLGKEAGMPPELDQFLDDGPAPIVFTLGSAVSSNPGRFFEYSIDAAKLLGCRAVLILKDSRNRPASLPNDVITCEYAPYSKLFPRASVIVHHGGIGTTGLAMRSGRPMLVVPHAWDQPDNAARVTRLGIARTLSHEKYVPSRVSDELQHLLDDASYAFRAREIGKKVEKEDGVRKACDELEVLLQTSNPNLAE